MNDTPEELSPDVSSLVDHELSESEERALRDRLGTPRVDALVQQERDAARLLRSALRPDDASVSSWQQRVRVTIRRTELGETSLAEHQRRWVHRLGPVGATAAAFLVGFVTWFILFRNPESSPSKELSIAEVEGIEETLQSGSTPAPPRNETVSPRASRAPFANPPRAAFVVDSTRRDFEPIPVPGDTGGSDSTHEVGLSRQTWTRRIVFPHATRAIPEGRSSSENSGTGPSEPAASAPRVILELERTETRLVRYRSDPWQ